MQLERHSSPNESHLLKGPQVPLLLFSPLLPYRLSSMPSVPSSVHFVEIQHFSKKEKLKFMLLNAGNVCFVPF